MNTKKTNSGMGFIWMFIGTIVLCPIYFKLMVIWGNHYVEANGIRGEDTNRIYMPIYLGGGQILSIFLSILTLLSIKDLLSIFKKK